MFVRVKNPAGEGFIVVDALMFEQVCSRLLRTIEEGVARRG